MFLSGRGRVAASLYLREMRNKDATSKLDVTGAVFVTVASLQSSTPS